MFDDILRGTSERVVKPLTKRGDCERVAEFIHRNKLAMGRSSFYYVRRVVIFLLLQRELIAFCRMSGFLIFRLLRKRRDRARALRWKPNL